MVSKLRKLTTKKQAGKPRLIPHRRRATPLKDITNHAALFFTSLHTCKRRLARLFTEILHREKPGNYKLLLSSPIPPSPLPAKTPPLPAKSSPDKKTIFLDLDETLIHSTTNPPPGQPYDFTVSPVIDGTYQTFYVLQRPGVASLLEEIGKNYEIIVFTAGLKEYASLVVDQLDPKGLISHRLYRDSCTQLAGKFVKDLSILGRDLRQVVIVDDNPMAYLYQPENAIPVKPFVDDLKDEELKKLGKFFEIAREFDDFRDAVSYFRSGIEETCIKQLNL